MPAGFVRLHLALVAVFVVSGLSFLADPCGGGGDLCLGGFVALVAFGIGGAGLIALGIWRFARRASPLLAFDAICVALGGYTVISTSGGTANLLVLGALVLVIAGVPALLLAGRALAQRRIEPVVAVIAFVAFAVIMGSGWILVTAIGLIGLGAGWVLARQRAAAPTSDPPEPRIG